MKILSILKRMDARDHQILRSCLEQQYTDFKKSIIVQNGKIKNNFNMCKNHLPQIILWSLSTFY
jgi:hypothetical protein